MKQLTYIDLFAGCGGLSLGLHLAGWKGLFAIEKNKDAFATLKHNLIDKLQHFSWVDWLPVQPWDINQVIEQFSSELEALQGKVDMLVGGPPCQGFSSAGKRKENDFRNGLVEAYLNFVELIKPKVIFFENVKGFTLKFEKNKTKGIAYSAYVVDRLGKMGYQVKGEMVDFSEYGVPQKRIRFILVGFRNDFSDNNNCEPSSFFELLVKNKLHFLAAKGINNHRVTLEEAISDLLKSNGTTSTPDRKNFRTGLYGKPKSLYQKVMQKGRDGSLPDSHSFANHTTLIASRFEEILIACQNNKNISIKEIQERFNISKHSIAPLRGNDMAPTLTTLPDDFIHYCEPRILTVREYARIQSFPDWFEFKGKYTTGGKDRIRDVPRYTQVGNAIAPLFGEQGGVILKQLLHYDNNLSSI